MNKEPKKGENWRKGYQAGIAEGKSLWQKEQAQELKAILNRCKTERGLATALVNYINEK